MTFLCNVHKHDKVIHNWEMASKLGLGSSPFPDGGSKEIPTTTVVLTHE